MERQRDHDGTDVYVKLKRDHARLRVAYMVLYSQYLELSDIVNGNGDAERKSGNG